MPKVWLLTVVITVLLGCSDSPVTVEGGEPLTLQAWAHAGQAGERKVIEAQVARFNKSNPDLAVELTLIPEHSYNAQLQAAAIAGDLPDLLEFDGPFIYNYAWQGHLQPLDVLLANGLVKDLLPSVLKQGRFHGKLYAVGSFDSGLGLYARRSALEAVGARIPSGPADAWTAAEFERLLKALAANDSDGAVLDLKVNYPGEWFSYAFSPVIASAGGDLINRHDYKTAGDVLNGPEAVDAMSQVQSWFKSGYVEANVDDAALVNGRVALSWAGHWEYRRYVDALADDLLILPLPNFGQGSRTGHGSWAWGISADGRRVDGAARFLNFLLQADEVLATANANGAIPARKSAIAHSELYRVDGPLHLFVEQLSEGYAAPRPQTPGYSVITHAFQQAFHEIRSGGDVQLALDKAVAMIDQDIHEHKGYP